MFSLMYRKGDNNPTHISWANNAFAVNWFIWSLHTQDVWNVNVFFREFLMFVKNWNAVLAIILCMVSLGFNHIWIWYI